MNEERDFDERMTTISCSEDDSARLDVYIALTTNKGFKAADDQEIHTSLRFCTECGVHEICNIPLSQLQKLISFLKEAERDWRHMEVEDFIGGTE